MKNLLIALITMTSLTAFADSVRSITTDDLTCVGTSDGKPNIILSVTAKTGMTRLTIEEAGRPATMLVNSANLVVGSEGNVYIQQVSNDLGYNLYLTGPELWDVLKGAAKKVKVDGNINLFKQNLVYDLKCEGTLN